MQKAMSLLRVCKAFGAIDGTVRRTGGSLLDDVEERIEKDPMAFSYARTVTLSDKREVELFWCIELARDVGDQHSTNIAVGSVKLYDQRGWCHQVRVSYATDAWAIAVADRCTGSGYASEDWDKLALDFGICDDARARSLGKVPEERALEVLTLAVGWFLDAFHNDITPEQVAAAV